MRMYVALAMLLIAHLAAAASAPEGSAHAPVPTASAPAGTAPAPVAAASAPAGTAPGPVASASSSAGTAFVPAQAPAAQHNAAVVPNDWAAPAMPEKAALRRAIKQSFEDEKAIANAEAKEKAIPRRYTASSHPEQDKDKYEKFAEEFDDAKVPGCLTPSGLKRQPTFIFGGLLALPFIAVAAIRGKCN